MAQPRCSLPTCSAVGVVQLWTKDPPTPGRPDGKAVLWMCLAHAEQYRPLGYRDLEESS